MTSHTVAGGGGTKLHVVQTGVPNGRPILYITGFSQCWMSWRRQLNSDLAQDYRLIAMDLRGHGLSEKPSQGYDDTKLWADDVNAVIDTLGLRDPVLCGWSYGPLLILDYIRHYGEARIGGMHFVDALTRLGGDDAMAVFTPELLALAPGFFSLDVKESVETLKPFLRLCFASEPAPEELYLMLGYNVSVSPSVRQAMFSRTINNDDLLLRLRKPVLITHGTADAVIKPIAASQHKASIPHAEMHMMNVGHAPFWEDAASFNSRQRAFCESIA